MPMLKSSVKRGERGKKRSRSDLSLNVIFTRSSVPVESVVAQFSTNSAKLSVVEVVSHQKMNGPVLCIKGKDVFAGEAG